MDSNPGFVGVANLIRGLNAADAARLLARYGYLEPEARPLTARGAAILLDCQPSSKTIDQLELEYGEETTRVDRLTIQSPAILCSLLLSHSGLAPSLGFTQQESRGHGAPTDCRATSRRRWYLPYAVVGQG